jgi:glycerol-3-phosphate dehydrogenase
MDRRQAMRRTPEKLAEKKHDVVIIGGGINGAGLARDLAMRGLTVALVEKGDYASGTSSASTKLIHGGLRYLENFDLGLVFEACRERQTLQKIAPHLVRPLRFYVPVYKGDKRPLWMVRAGMLLYDLLAMFRNTHMHGMLSAAKAVDREPALRREGLKGVAVYWDCKMDDARLCLENVIAAAEAGAVVSNYVEVTGLPKKNGRLTGVELLDLETDRQLMAEADVVVNMTGPWMDKIRAMDGDHEPMLRTTRGAHILVPRVNRGDEAIYLASGRDDRLFFVIPWGDLSLIGTTDTDTEIRPEETVATEDDIDYLLAESARHLQGTALTRECVIASFAGLRPLVADTRDTASNVSREHRIFESASGLISVGGGKYTTYRAVAEEVAALIVDRLGKGERKSTTNVLPLPGGNPFSGAAAVEQLRANRLLPATAEFLVNRYGSRIGMLIELLNQDDSLAAPVVDGSTLTKLEVLYGVEYEQARTPDDVLRRRTGLSLGDGQGFRELDVVARLLQQQLGADEEIKQQWINDYREAYSRNGRK